MTDNQGATGTDTMIVTVNAAPPTGYTSAQVATHNTQSNCWLILTASGVSKVYNVTSFMSQGLHPPGASYIVPFCGTDSTSAFNTNGSQNGHTTHNHSSSARNKLPTYYIGDLLP